jgi:hypothetical protein
VIILTGHIDTLFHVEQIDITSLPEVASALRQAHLDAAFHVVGSAYQNRAACLPNVICSGLFSTATVLCFLRTILTSLTG